MHITDTAPMLGRRVNTVLPWSACKGDAKCQCRAGSTARKDERRIQGRRERAAVRNQLRKEVY